MFDIIIKTFKTGTVTTKYPDRPDIAPAGFRGKPEFLPERCTLCGECAKVCPPGVIWLTNDTGTLFTVAADAQEFRLLSSAKVIEKAHEAWAPMALAGGRLLVRDLTQMVCLDLREPAK